MAFKEKGEINMKIKFKTLKFLIHQVFSGIDIFLHLLEGYLTIAYENGIYALMILLLLFFGAL